VFEGVAWLEESATRHSNVETTLILNEKDELVSYHGVLDLIEEKELDNWNVHKIRKMGVKGPYAS